MFADPTAAREKKKQLLAAGDSLCPRVRSKLWDKTKEKQKGRTSSPCTKGAPVMSMEGEVSVAPDR